MSYDLNLLPIFVALMEERSVTRAAERMGMTQPALSNALSRLRLMLQDQLFVRERYGIQPTPIALELSPLIAEALAQLDDAILGQQAFDPAQAERLFTIAPNGYVEFVLVPAVVARLEKVAPGIKLRLTPYGNDLVETGVVSGTTALVLGRIVDPPDNLVVQHLMDEGLACAVRADHPDVGDAMTREQFEAMKHVNIVPPGRMRAGLFQALAHQQLKRDVAISVTNFFAVAEMVAVTDYCATLSSESGLNIPADMIHYGVTKTADLALSRGLAKRMAGTGVTVNAILPGPMLSEGVTEMLADAVASGKSLEEAGADFVKAHRPSSIIRRAATVGEVANLCVYIASPQASATTGAALRVDGGVVDTIA